MNPLEVFSEVYIKRELRDRKIFGRVITESNTCNSLDIFGTIKFDVRDS